MADAASQAETGPEGPERISEEELRKAYESELRRITASDLIVQTVASLINVGAFRLGLTGGEESERDLEQVRDAIEGVRALLPILERRGDAQQLRPLRDALSQLQMAYAREVQSAPASAEDAAPPAKGRATEDAPAEPEDGAAETRAPESGAPAGLDADASRSPGPAETSGRLWVPGNG